METQLGTQKPKLEDFELTKDEINQGVIGRHANWERYKKALSDWKTS